MKIEIDYIWEKKIAPVGMFGTLEMLRKNQTSQYETVNEHADALWLRVGSWHSHEYQPTYMWI